MSAEWLRGLPHVTGTLNAVIALVLLAAFVAVRRGHVEVHRRLMSAAVILGVAFLLLYVFQSAMLPHRRFPGHDWVRTLFVTVLVSHEILAVVLVPMVVTTFGLARRGRTDAHRRRARLTYPLWMYVAVTGVAIYVLNTFVRPRG